MKLKRYLCFFAVCLFLLVGCGAKGSVKEINTKELITKLDNKESFIISFSQTTCPHCITFKEMLDGYLKKQEVTVYDVVLDKEDDFDWAIGQLETKFPSFNGTPDVYIIENGQIKSRLWDELEAGEGFTEDNFHNWLTKYGIVK